jgi:hypothetical protein
MALIRLASGLCFALTLAACGDGPSGPGAGTVEVTTVSTGEDVDADGYLVQVEGAAAPLAIGANATETVSGVPAGDIQVRLTAVRGNCRSQDDDLRTIRVIAGETFRARFEVSCVRSPLLGRIVFTSSRGGNFDIYSSKPDGSDRVRLTDTPDFQEFSPSSSPDGARIVYYGRDGNLFDDFFQYDVYVMSADGTGQTKLTDSLTQDEQPVWSPDGTRIAFVSGFLSDIWIMNADGSRQVNLTNTPESSDYAPWWSADGIRIFYSADGGERHVMNADGSGQTLLPGEPADVAPGSLSPDGTRIAFSSYQSGANKVFVIHADGSDRVRLTDMPGNEYDPSWSPDGTRLAFNSDAVGRNDVFVINADGTGLVNITNDAAAVERTGPRAWGP